MTYRVLVVEDDPTPSRVIGDDLETEGYLVDVAADGTCAVRLTRASTPDLIVLDLTLQDHDGLDHLLPVLRLRGKVPAIILTARIKQAAKLKGLRLGADDYITKPFDPDELLARIRAVLRRAARH